MRVMAPSEMYSSFGGSHTASWTGSGSVFISCFCVWRGEVKGSEEQCPREWGSTGKDLGPAITARRIPKVESEAWRRCTSPCKITEASWARSLCPFFHDSEKLWACSGHTLSHCSPVAARGCPGPSPSHRSSCALLSNV